MNSPVPDKFSFEVIETEFSGSLWNRTGHASVMKIMNYFLEEKNMQRMYWSIFANRLGLCEYLERIKKQATAIFFREVDQSIMLHRCWNIKGR